MKKLLRLLSLFLAALSFLAWPSQSQAKESVLVLPQGQFEKIQKDQVLERINAIRMEAYQEGLSDSYQPLVWSQGLEPIARLRASELVILQGHRRPNGDAPFFEVPTHINHSGESLAWNNQGALYAVEQFYAEKEDYKAYRKSHPGMEDIPDAVYLDIGHYDILIAPRTRSLAFASFLPDGYQRFQIAFEFSQQLEDPDRIEPWEPWPDSIPVEAERVRDFSLALPKTIHVGERLELEGTVRLKRQKFVVEGTDFIDLPLVGGLQLETQPEGGLALENNTLLGLKEGKFHYLLSLGKLRQEGEIQVLDSTSHPSKDPTQSQDVWGEKRVQGISGPAREHVAASLALSYFPKAKTLLLVQDLAFPDAMSAANLSQGTMPILYSKKSSIPQVTLEAMEKIPAQEILLVGGPNTLDPSLEESLRSHFPDRSIRRISGIDRYALNASTLKGQGPLFLVSGQVFSDALISAPLAFAAGGRVALSEGSKLPPVLEKKLTQLDPDPDWTMVGGKNSLSDGVRSQLQAIHGGTIERIAAADRYLLSAEVSKRIPAKRALLVSGEVFADALVAAPLAQQWGVPILLTKRKTLSEPVRRVLSQKEEILLLGGEDSISPEITASLAK